MSGQKDVFEIIERMRPDPPPPRAPPPLQLQELELETHPCSSCGLFSFHRPTVCYWCRKEAT